MTSIKRNLVANFLGKIWTALMSIIFLPYYIKLIGVESYGLVGIYVSLLALFAVLDLGLCTTMNREMARLSSQGSSPEEFRNVTRTLEILYWAIAILIGASIFFAAPFLAENWFIAKELSPEVIKQALYCIGIALAFFWPSSFYSGGLMGLQKQVLLNGIAVFSATLRGIGMVIVLTFISPTIQAFFIWQIIVNLLQTCLTAFCLWSHLPLSNLKPRFNLEILKSLKGFTIGIAGTTALGIILAQLDKVILSKILTLDTYGYYVFATTVASSLYYIIGPIFSAFFPHFTQLVYANNLEDLKRVYHIACQLMSSLILPITLLVVLFSPELIYLWTRNAETVENTYLLVKLLMIGTAFHGLLTLPYALQLAYGSTKLIFYLNLASVVLIIPLLLWSANKYGSVGAANVWVIVNAGAFFVAIPAMHKKLLKQENWSWFVQDVGLPLLVALSIVLIGRWYFPKENINGIFPFFYLGLTYVLAVVSAILISPSVRSWVMRSVIKRKSMI